MKFSRKLNILVVLLLAFSLFLPSIAGASSLTSGTEDSPYLNEGSININTELQEEYTEEEILDISIDVLKNNGYSEEEVEVMLKELEEIQDYFVRNANDSVFFDSEKAIKDGVNQELVARTEADMATLGGVDGGVSLLDSCPGASGWVATKKIIFFDSCQTNTLVYALSSGSNIVTIAGIITGFAAPPVGVPIAVAGVLINQGSSYINYKDRGYGIAVFYNRTPIEIHGQ